jgi:hypothetical protein
MNAWFRVVGFPQFMYWVNGLQFDAAEFKDYCAANFITPLNSSSCFPKSNGLAEAAVKRVKYLLLKLDNYSNFVKKLYEMQSLHSSWYTLSPAEKKINRHFRTKLSTLKSFFDLVVHAGRKQFLV